MIVNINNQNLLFIFACAHTELSVANRFQIKSIRPLALVHIFQGIVLQETSNNRCIVNETVTSGHMVRSMMPRRSAQGVDGFVVVRGLFSRNGFC